MSAGRPRIPRITIVGSGYQVEVPAEPGSRQRIRHTFDDLEQAQAWCEAAHAALDAGQPVPARVPAAPVQVPARPAPRSFAEVAQAWLVERYDQLRTAQGSRRAQVEARLRNHVLPWADARGYRTGTDITRAEYLAFLVALAQPAQASPPTTTRELTIPQAVTATGASVSTIKRRIRTGEVRSRLDDDGRRLVDAASLQATLGDTALQRGPRTDQGCVQDTIGDIRWVLDQVLQYGVDTQGWTLTFSPERVPTPRSQRQTPRRGQLSLSDCARLAEHLHPAHQITLWLIRILGLRIGEAYGLRLDDVIQQDARSIVRVRRQGGRVFDAGVHDGTRRTATTKDRLKTTGSVRALIAPPCLVDLLAAATAVFHTDDTGQVRATAVFHTDDTGQVRATARIIPGLTRDDESGQGSFRTALREAGLAAGIDLATGDTDLDAQLLPSPKDARAGALTDLAWSDLPALARHRFGGHATGTAVAERHYVLDHPDLAPLVAAADELERLVTQALPDGLLVPTTRSCTTGLQPALAARKDHIDAALVDLGWWTVGVDADGNAVLTAAQAAQALGVNERTVRRWARDGRLHLTDGPGGHRRYLAASVDALCRRNTTRRRLTDVVTDLGVGYHRAWQWLRASGLPIETTGPGAVVYLPTATETALARWVEQRQALALRAVTVSEVARLLRCTPAAVQALLVDGVLALDPERGDQGARHITRASLAAYIDRADGVNADVST